VETVLKAHHSLPAGIMSRHFDCVFDGLGSAVHQKRPLRVTTGSDTVEPLGELDIGLVGSHWKAHMGKLVELALDRVDHLGVPVTRVHHADASAEVDEPVAVNVGQHRAFGMRHRHRSDGRHPAGDCLGAALEERATPGSGDFGLEMNDAGHLGSQVGERRRDPGFSGVGLLTGRATI
jgi:hypothetical protein